MTISNTSNLSPYYAGSGTTGPFAFSFKIFTTADVQVRRTNPSNVTETLVESVDYTVSMNGDQNANPGGTITLTQALDIDYTLVMRRVVDATQETDLQQGGAFLPEVIENALDKLTMLMQQVEEAINRALVVASSIEGLDLNLPTPQANMLLRWNSLANALENFDLASYTFGTDPGKQTMYVPAGAIWSRLTNGPAANVIELGTNKTMVASLDFDGATAEYAQVEIGMPKSWNEGTITLQFDWSHTSGAAAFGVRWNARAKDVADGEALDGAFGTEQSVSDTGGTTDYRYLSAETGAITIANTPSQNGKVVIEIYRDPTHADDTMSTRDARLHGVFVHYATDAANDA